MFTYIYLRRLAFFSLSSLRKVCRKPKILNTMWCCCFYLLSSFQIQHKLYEKWHNFSCKLEAARIGENKMWASLLVLVHSCRVLLSGHTHPPSSSHFFPLAHLILETSWMSLCLLSVIMGMTQANSKCAKLMICVLTSTCSILCLAHGNLQ